jgi:hypothetical protein
MCLRKTRVLFDTLTVATFSRNSLTFLGGGGGDGSLSCAHAPANESCREPDYSSLDRNLYCFKFITTLTKCNYRPLRFRKEHYFLKVSRLFPYVLVRATCTWRWAWSTGGMILTGENRSNRKACRFVHRKSNMQWLGIEPGPQQSEAGE